MQNDELKHEKQHNTVLPANMYVYREYICLQTLFLSFKCSKRQTKVFVSPANSSLVGILITIGDVTDIFAIQYWR